MDNATIQLIARLKIRMRQEKNISINTQRFFAEPAYAGQVLDQAEESEDMELVTTSMELRSKLGWLQAPAAAATTAAPVKAATSKPAANDNAPQRYAFGARS